MRREGMQLWDVYADYVPGAFTWLQVWSAGQVSRENRVTIETLDNPGWTVSIDLFGTDVANANFEPKKVHRGEHDWYVVRVVQGRFDATCGPTGLGEVLDAFRVWVETQTGLKRTRLREMDGFPEDQLSSD